MTTLTVSIEDKKTEKAVKAVLDALNVDYSIARKTEPDLNKSEQAVYERLKKTAGDIKLYKEGKLQFQDARDFLNEL